MDFQKMKQVDEGSSSSSSKKANKLFDLNLLPEEEEEDNDEFYIEIFGGFETPQSALNLTDNNKVGDTNSNSNGLVLPPSFPISGGDNNGVSVFNNTTISSAATKMVTPSNHPFDLKKRVRHNDDSSASTGTARSLRPRRPEPNYERRICTNYNCRTRNTPMWRRGPLGPKTLCNACGIQYKKQVTSRGSDLV